MTNKRIRLRQHLEALTFIEVQRLFLLSLPYPKEHMIETIIDCARDEHLNGLIASFEAEDAEKLCQQVGNSKED